MSAFNFKDQFVPHVEDWSKTHTIRAPRKVEQKLGMPMHLYRGLRHPGARCLMITSCVRQTCLQIEKDYTIWIGSSVGMAPRSQPDRLKYDLTYYGDGPSQGTHGRMYLDSDEKNLLAWRDGFRPAGSSLENPRNAFDLMCEFWEKDRVNAKTDPLPFFGIMHHWNPQIQWKKDGRYLRRFSPVNPRSKAVASQGTGVGLR